ncbi:MAG: hypothetical protein N2252_07400 [Candidatus Kryptonium sp.]|nr:hypothetical protein [Candidatus Kryptonium sp.]
MLHPIFVHFPIGLFTTAFIFEIVEFITKDKFKNSSLLVLSLSVLFSIIAAQTGNIEAKELSLSGDLGKVLTLHQENANLFLFISTLVFMLKLYISLRSKSSSFYVFMLLIVFYLIGLLFVSRTAYYGAKLVFEYGVGIKQS